MKSIIKHLGLGLILTLFFSVSLQAANKFMDVETQNRSVAEFTSISLMCSADLYITQGNSQEVTVKADGKNINMLQTRVENGKLIIDMKKHFGSLNFHVLEVHVTVKQLDKISDFGSGDVKVKGSFKAKDLVVSLHGSGDFNGDLDVQNLKLNVKGSGDANFNGVKGTFELSVMGSGDVEGYGLQLESCGIESMGSGDVELSGTAKDLSLSQKGSGDFNGYGLKTETVNISNYGSGDALVNVSQSIRARLYGSGDVLYRGGADKVSVSAMGSGGVYKK
ncbi:MAG: DUF2807 domain-containing protein [Bacteroidales bacterium]|nr:DUF2807 domain-containing protein [Bacteroidales bacterium]